MEQLFSFLPAVIILIAVVGRLLKKFRKMFTTFEPQLNDYYSEKADAEDNSQARLLSEESAGQISQSEDKGKETKKLAQRSSGIGQSQKRKSSEAPTTNSNLQSSWEKSDKIKASEGKVITESDFNKREIVKGIVFKEILGQPRAKKPHRLFR